MKLNYALIWGCAAIACVYAQNPVIVEAFDEQGNNSSRMTLRLKLTNNTSDTLSDVRATYFLDYDRSRVLDTSQYYMEGAVVSIDTLGDFLAVNMSVPELFFHLNGSTIWRSRTLNEDLEEVAKGFMLIQHGNETMTVEGMWTGTIFAPNADLVLGQSSKTLYGRFIGKDVTIHQYSKVIGVAFNPNQTVFVLKESF